MTSSSCCSHLDNPAPHISLSHTEISRPHNLQVAGGSLGHKWTRLSVLHILICKAYHTFQLKIGHQRFVLSQMEIGVTRRRRRRRMESLVRQNSRVVQSLLPFFLSMLPISFRVVIRWLPTLVFPMFTHSPTSSSSSIVPLSTPPPPRDATSQKQVSTKSKSWREGWCAYMYQLDLINAFCLV
jgi:hypothetical protein